MPLAVSFDKLIKLRCGDLKIRIVTSWGLGQACRHLPSGEEGQSYMKPGAGQAGDIQTAREPATRMA